MSRRHTAAFSIGIVASPGAPAAEPPRIDLPAWTPPQIDPAGDDPFGRLVRNTIRTIREVASQVCDC
jgi:hypothetical protein